MKRRSLLSLLLALVMCFSMVTVAGAEQSTYTGTATGFGNQLVTVTVTLEDGKVVGIEVDGSTQSYAMAGIAKEDSVDKVIAGILADGNTDNYPIDTVSSATFTTNAIITVVNEALAGGKEDLSNVEISYIPGTYTGTARGRNGNVSVEVTVSADRIESVTVLPNSESLGVSDLPQVRIPEEIVAYQSLGVDTVSGATITSTAVLNAASNALEQSGVNVAALRAVPVNYPEMDTADLETQVVVAGGGAAGLIAALKAADEGAQVILVEKNDFLGGSLIVAGGGFAVANGSKHMASVGLDDSLETAMNFVRTVNANALHQPDYDFIEYVLSETGKTDDYMVYDLGLTVEELPASGDHAVQRSAFAGFPTFGAGMVKEVEPLIEQKNITVLLSTSAESVIMEGDRAVGLTVRNRSGEYTIKADQIILATGGAPYDMERLIAANPSLALMSIDQQASVGDTGDGVQMLEEIGVQMGEGPFVKTSSYPSFASQFAYYWLNNPTPFSQMLFDANGLRFANEAVGADMGMSTQLNVDIIRHGSEAAYLLYDAHNVPEDLKALFEQYAPEGNKAIVVKGSNIEEIAEKLGISARVLRATYDRYQTECANGLDVDQGKPAEYLIAYNDDEGLYAAAVRPGSWGTIGGVLTDRQFRVQKTDGTVIDNLFAVGELSTSTLFGDAYMGSFSLGYYATAARIAAETAVAQLNSK